MTKTELMDYILVNTNQYFVGLENFEIKEPILDGLLKRAFGIYGKYNPVTILAPVLISSTYMKFNTMVDELGIERTVQNISGIFYSNFRTYPADVRDDLKVMWRWEFDKTRKILNTSFSNFDASSTYYIEFLCNPVLEDINYDDTLFLDLITALSYIYIGHNRNDFALSELPFDITDLRDEGKEMFDNVMEALKSGGNTGWSKAIDLL